MATEGKWRLKVNWRACCIFELALLGVAGWSGNRPYTILKTWLTVDAQVTKGQVTHYLSRAGTKYQPEIEFRYKVNEKEYLAPSSSIHSSSGDIELKRKVESYAPGTIHAVRYNPGNPNDIRSDAGYTFGLFSLPISFGAFGLFITALGIRVLAASRGAVEREAV
jgi:hypothetical protein